MKKHKISTWLFASLMLTVVLLSACSRIKVGYLRTTGASFTPDTMFVYKKIDTESARYKNKAPWVSTRIQGVAGTNPINYEYVSVEASNGGDATLFHQLASKGRINVYGGLVQVHQDAVEQLPNGNYTISIKVYNDEHSNLLSNIFTIVVDNEEVVNEPAITE